METVAPDHGGACSGSSMLGVHCSGHALRPDREAWDRLHAIQPGPRTDTARGPAQLLCRSCSARPGARRCSEKNAQRALTTALYVPRAARPGRA